MQITNSVIARSARAINLNATTHLINSTLVGNTVGFFVSRGDRPGDQRHPQRQHHRHIQRLCDAQPQRRMADRLSSQPKRQHLSRSGLCQRRAGQLPARLSLARHRCRGRRGCPGNRSRWRAALRRPAHAQYRHADRHERLCRYGRLRVRRRRKLGPRPGGKRGARAIRRNCRPNYQPHLDSGQPGQRDGCRPPGTITSTW